MVYHGRVTNGRVILDAGGALPEGARVTVEIVLTEPSERDDGSLANELLKIAGSCTGLPSDYSEQHDHYLYGVPKQ